MSYMCSVRIPPGIRDIRRLPGAPFGEFETCPDWVPGMDTGSRVAPISLKTMRAYRFDHRANWVAKVRNVSRLGSQTQRRDLILRIPLAATSTWR